MNIENAVTFEGKADLVTAAQNSILLASPWGMDEVSMAGVKDAVESMSPEAVLKYQGERPPRTQFVQVRGDVAIMDIKGPIVRWETLLSWVFDWPSVEVLSLEFQKLLDNRQIETIIFNHDSPGGMVNGINEFAEQVFQARDRKKIVSYVGSLAASADYWLASAAEEIVIDPTAQLGSIGTVVGFRKQTDNTTQIVNTDSPNKRPDLNSEEGLAEIRKRLNAIAEVFFSRVARNRSVTVDQVKALRGSVVVGQESIQAGLADRQGSLEELIETYMNKTFGGSRMEINVANIKTHHADVAQALIQEGKAQAEQSNQEALTAARTEAKAEVVEVAKVVLGQEVAAKLDTAVASGLSVEQIKSAQALFGNQEAQAQNQNHNAQADPNQQILQGIQNAHGHQGLNNNQNTQAAPKVQSFADYVEQRYQAKQ